MAHKLTISLDNEVYQGLHETIGRGHISQFIQQLVRPYVIKKDLEAAYLQMSQDKQREIDADTWSENLIGDTHTPPQSTTKDNR
jgi:predicted CopG family antitoxin